MNALTLAAPDRWRHRMLGAAMLPLLVVAFFVVNDLRIELAERAASPELRDITDPFWQLATPVFVTLSHCVLAFGAVAGFLSRRNERWSTRIVLFAFAASLPLQVLPRLAPLSWQYELTPELHEQVDGILDAAAPLMAVGCIVDLLPLVLSITVGLARAGLHRHAVAPEQPAGATVAFVALLQLGLLFAIAVGVAANFMTTHWLVIGLVLLLAHYAVAATICFLLARPRAHRSPRLRGLLLASALLFLLPGVVELAIGLSHLEILDKPLIGWGDHEGLLSPTKLATELLLFVSRALITAVAANDLLARAQSS